MENRITTKYVQCYGCNGTGYVLDGRSTSGQSLCKLCNGLKYTASYITSVDVATPVVKSECKCTKNAIMIARDNEYFNENDEFLFESSTKYFVSKVYKLDGKSNWYTTKSLAYKATSLPCINLMELKDGN